MEECATWYSCGPLSSTPAIISESPNGRTPPDCVNSCITAAISAATWRTGISSWYVDTYFCAALRPRFRITR